MAEKIYLVWDNGDSPEERRLSLSDDYENSRLATLEDLENDPWEGEVIHEMETDALEIKEGVFRIEVERREDLDGVSIYTILVAEDGERITMLVDG